MGNDFYTPAIENDHIPNKFEIGEDCLIENAIIDKCVHIGNGVRLTNKDKLKHYDGDKIYIRDGIIIISRGAHLPDGFIL